MANSGGRWSEGWRGLERRQSFWQVETIDKLISDVGRKLGKRKKMSGTILDKFAKKGCALPAHIRKVAFENWRQARKKKAQKEREKVSEKLENKVTPGTFQKLPF